MTMVTDQQFKFLLWSFAIVSIPAANISYASFHIKPELYNVRCDVRDLETTIKWNITPPDEDLMRTRYLVRFCPPTECKTKQKLHCFKDDARTKKLQKVDGPSCKASISQLLTWNSYYFKISARYRNLTSGDYVTISNWTVCQPITRQTSLSPPNITTLATKTSITVTLNLNKNLQRTLKKTKVQGDLSMSDVTYYYYLIPKRQNKRRSQPSPERKSLNHYESFENIAPNEEYNIRGWYTIKTLKNEKSEVASIREKTKPDPFPQWAQIMFICGVSSLVIVSMISAFTYNVCRKREQRVKAAKFKSTLAFEQCLNEIHSADPCLTYDALEDEEPVILARLLTEPDVLANFDVETERMESCSSQETTEIPATEEVSQYIFVDRGYIHRQNIGDYSQVEVAST